MGHERVEEVIAALRDGGIRAVRAYPARKMPYLSEPVAAVILQQSKVNTTKLAVQIFGPMNRGGVACEDAALRAAEIVRTLGGYCTIGECGFNGKMGLFHQTVTVSFALIATE